MHQGPQQPWPAGRQPGPPPAEPPRSTAMLTATWVVTSIVGLAYIGLFVLMGLGASDEISTIEKLKEMKAGGAPITNTVEDLDESIAENELAIVVFFVGAALTLPLVIASFLAGTGRAWVRVTATIFLVPPIVVIVFGVVHDIRDGHPENAFALVFTLPAIVLAILWWLPATTRAMTARRLKREPVPPVPQGYHPAYR
ncbi:hypothetical protein [Actinophytocola glycyrrhizae]|uniref:Uncharacterized protein n=1 Tax=Actinophytocola glycyrrhizae TaxID=2044873 RepID=A0ABV9SA65_9PSEU